MRNAPPKPWKQVIHSQEKWVEERSQTERDKQAERNEGKD